MFDVPSSEFGTMTAVVSIDQPEVVRFLGDKYDFGHIFSPDMSHIAYVHYGRSIYDGPDLYIMQADGSHKTRIMTDVWQFVWLPNSQELAYIHATNDQYYLSIITRDGGSLRRIPLPCCISRFKWSSDGTQFLFAGPDLFVMNADGTNFHQLTAFSYGQIDDYDWSPDGSQVVFSYQDVGTHPHSWPRTDRLYIVSIDGGYQRLITHEDIATIGPGEVAGNEGSQYPVWQPVLR
jgi:Tol biopolymer transport system component